MITNKSFNFVHVIYLQCIQSLTSFFLQIEECGSKFELMFVFWAAQSLAASCPGRHEQVWAMYVASVSFLSPFPPQSRLGFSLCVHLLWALASSPLSVHNQFSRCIFSAHTAPHLLSLSSYVFSTSKNLFWASGECGAWMPCLSSAVRECGARLRCVSAVHECSA
jgi:hypothetical protein